MPTLGVDYLSQWQAIKLFNYIIAVLLH